MERSYLIKQCARFNGVTYLTVDGQVEKEDVGRKIIVESVSDQTANGNVTIFEVVPPDTIRFAQPGMLDIRAALKGGRVVFAPVAEEPVTPPVAATKPPVPPVAAKPTPPPVRIPLARGIPLKK